MKHAAATLELSEAQTKRVTDLVPGNTAPGSYRAIELTARTVLSLLFLSSFTFKETS
nr:hypothetical protein [uncultured Roseateles sp.]